MDRKRRTNEVGPLPPFAGGPSGGRAEAASRGVEAVCDMASDACGTDPRRRPSTGQRETSSAGGSPETFTRTVPERPARTTASSTSAAAIVRRVGAGWGAVRAMTRWLMPWLSAGRAQTCVGVHPEISTPVVLGGPDPRPGVRPQGPFGGLPVRAARNPEGRPRGGPARPRGDPCETLRGVGGEPLRAPPPCVAATAPVDRPTRDSANSSLCRQVPPPSGLGSGIAASRVEPGSRPPVPTHGESSGGSERRGPRAHGPSVASRGPAEAHMIAA